jgi:stage IV sporulation protein FB
MDGGRVLRALLAYRLGYARGTQIAASVGQFVAFGLGLLGLFGNPLLIFIALFVYLGAASEASAVQMREVSRGLLAGDAMVTRFESLSPNSRVADAVECLIRTTQHEFPVVDGGGRLRGVLTRDDMIRALRETGPETSVLEVMRRDIPVVPQRGSLEQALRTMQEQRLPAVGVEDSGGRLVGLVTPENIGEMMMVHALRPARRAPPNPWSTSARGP